MGDVGSNGGGESLPNDQDWVDALFEQFGGWSRAVHAEGLASGAMVVTCEHAAPVLLGVARRTASVPRPKVLTAAVRMRLLRGGEGMRPLWAGKCSGCATLYWAWEPAR